MKYMIPIYVVGVLVVLGIGIDNGLTNIAKALCDQLTKLNKED